METQWITFEQSDFNKDGIVTLEEFKARAAIDKREWNQVLQDAFDKIDTDQDGKWTFSEYWASAYRTKYPYPANLSSINQAFEANLNLSSHMVMQALL